MEGSIVKVLKECILLEPKRHLELVIDQDFRKF